MRTLPRLLSGLESQDYPKNKLEVIFIDGNSTDGTIDLINSSSLKPKFKIGKIPNDPETCKGEGLSIAKGEIVGLIDSDNYIPHKAWLTKMIKPLIENKDLVGSYTWRFAYRKEDNILNRYFSLIGSADPVGLYLRKADKFSYITDQWVGFGKLISENKNYFIVEFGKKYFPTLGSNGFFARKKYLMKGQADMSHFFHIDVPFDILKFGLNKYAIVKDVIIHDTAIDLLPYIKKRARYMQLHYQKRAADRRYKVFDSDSRDDLFNLATFIFFSFTFLQPLYVATKGYLKIQDKAWFMHPVFCFSIVIAYAFAVFKKSISRVLK